MSLNMVSKKEASMRRSSWQRDGEKWKLIDFPFLGSEIIVDVDCFQDICSIKGKLLQS